MTTILSTPAHAAAVPPAERRMQRLLRLDAAATAGTALLALALPTTVFGDVPSLLPRAVGAVLLVVAADMALASRWRGRRLRIATVITGQLGAAWVVATAVLLAGHDLQPSGAVVLVGVGLVAAGFTVAELWAARAHR